MSQDASGCSSTRSCGGAETTRRNFPSPLRVFLRASAPPRRKTPPPSRGAPSYILVWRMSRPKFALAALAGLAAALYAQQGYKDTPITLPGQRWHVHDPDRPHPRAVTPGAEPERAAIRRHCPLRWQRPFQVGAARSWQNGRREMESRDRLLRSRAGHRDLISRDRFGDCQLHVEWSEPTYYRARLQPGPRQ